ncbi:MAG: hypothetical protein WCF79_23030 [Rhodomicrobium sp.]
MKTRDLILSLSKDEAKISSFGLNHAFLKPCLPPQEFRAIQHSDYTAGWFSKED